MRHSLFYPASLGFVVGISIASFRAIPVFILIVILIDAVICILYFAFSRHLYSKEEIKEYSKTFIIFVFILAGIFGILRYELFTQYKGDPILRMNIGNQIEGEGIITSDPEERENKTQAVLTLQKINTTKIQETNILISDDPYSSLKYGNEIKIEGTLTLPENFDSDTGRSFDYISYLAKDRIFYTIDHPQIHLIEKDQGNSIIALLFSLKHAFIKNLDAVIPFPESRLAAGLTVAGKRALPQSVQDDFQKSGTMQVVVLSGYNVTIIAEMLAALLAFLPELIGAGAGITGIILFTLMTGASATIVRGSIMAILVLIAGTFRRRYSVGRSLTVSGIVMLMINPMLLIFDPSFQFSFLATFGLIYFSPLIVEHLSWIPEKFNLRATAGATMATQLFLLPFILFQTGEISIAALPANLLLFLFMPITMLFSFLAAMIAFLLPIASIPLAWAAFLFLSYELWVVHFFASVPFMLFTIPSFPWWLMHMCYAGFIVLVVRHNQKAKREADEKTHAHSHEVFIKKL